LGSYPPGPREQQIIAIFKNDVNSRFHSKSKKVRWAQDNIHDGKLTENKKYKKGQTVQYQLDKGSTKALKPSVGTISNVKKVGTSFQYTIQDGGPVPVWGAEIIDTAFKKGDKVKYLDHHGTITNVDIKPDGRIFYSVAYDKGTGKTKAKGILSTSGSITENKWMGDLSESGILYKAGVKKYGKEGMQKIQSAAGKRKSHAAIGAIKDKYEKG